ncbi:MAG TPA: HPP family protein [Gammaproteobacteria bacterium]|nr:HPP family protein [Gammaproteobacteria bacterium]
MNWRQLPELLYPSPDNTSVTEKLISGLGGLVAIGLIMLASSHYLAPRDLPWVVASMGASAVLLFAVPLGPLSQPWSLVGGHLISGVIGVTVMKLVPDITIAAALAVSLAIFVMYLTRCLHPPGGATALTVVVGSESIHQLGYQYLLTPVLMNVIIMLAWALLINNLLPNRYYPNTLKSILEKNKTKIGEDTIQTSLSITRDDLRFALKEMNEFIDVSEDDLSRLFNLSATHSRRKRIGELLCSEIMTKETISAEYDTEVETLWKLMGKHQIRGIPIIDRNKKVIGIVTIADFLNQVKLGDEKIPLKQRLEKFLKRTDGNYADKPEYAGHVMTTPVTTIKEEQHILDLFPLFYQKGIHHLPVVDDENHLRGMITSKNLLAALHSDVTNTR